MNQSENNPPTNNPSLPLFRADAETESLLIPVIEEQIQISKQVVETGRVRISKTVHEDEQLIDLPLLHEEFHVERVAVNQYVDSPPAVRVEGDTTVYPVLKEVVVVEKKLILVEEVHVTRRQLTTNDPQHVILRREEITVDRIASETGRPA